MAIPLNVFAAQVDGLIDADNDIIIQLRRDRIIKQAVEQYSHDAPNTEADDVTGDAGKFYILSGGTSVLSNWLKGFSRVQTIEYPAAVIASDETPIYLEPEDWDDDYWAGDVQYLWLPNHAPTSSEKMRVTYTVPFLWTKSTTVTTAVSQATHGFSVNDYVYLSDTTWYEADDAKIATHVVSVAATDTFTAATLEANIPTEDFFAICNLAACLICRAIATKFSKAKESTIAIDSATHTSKAAEYSTRAKEYCDAYSKHLGIGDFVEPGADEPSGEFVDWDTAPGFPPGRQYVFHRDR